MRETRERERWEGVLRGIEEKVNQEYGFRNYFIKNEPKQTWMPMRQEVKSNSEGAVRDYDLMG